MKTDPESSPTQRALKELDLLVRSRYPIIYLLTFEESRIENLIFGLAGDQGKPLFTWTATRGLREHVQSATDARSGGRGEHNDPADVLNHIMARTGAGLFLLKDFHPFMDDPQIIRLLRDAYSDLKGSYKTILITSPRLSLPAELEKDVTLVDFPLPDEAELLNLLKSVCRTLVQKNRQAVQLSSDDARAMVRGALGLTLTEAESAFAKAAVTGGVIDPGDVEIVLNEKKQIKYLRQSRRYEKRVNRSKRFLLCAA